MMSCRAANQQSAISKQRNQQPATRNHQPAISNQGCMHVVGREVVVSQQSISHQSAIKQQSSSHQGVRAHVVGPRGG
eukprot:148216-Prymnesium_polylepis.1